MSVSLNSNFFEVFGLPLAFAIDHEQLVENYRVLQKQFHPDRFVNEDAATRRQAIQLAAHINEAHNALNDPLLRAKYLVQLAIGDAADESGTSSDGGFLMRQMELREELEELPNAGDPFAAIDSLRNALNTDAASLYTEFDSAYGAGDFSSASDVVTKLQFYQRLLTNLKETEARLEDELF